MAEDIKTKLDNYRTAPFDARFPNQNQTKNCWSNYLGSEVGRPEGGGDVSREDMRACVLKAQGRLWRT
ncbi:hypothetical protein NHX12_024771 [Muraenolepis orangiensis]|uniref:Uncharacterized protein n=1 Tax=Muraenolepis orangiensis TaxID=630683 RepID=A0A9Q0IRM6_9TELE|nr:hypothetical protein NHX12_024771 [Muraenolepis orangiensis]